MYALDPELRVVMRIDAWDDIGAVFGVVVDANMRQVILHSPTPPSTSHVFLPDNALDEADVSS